MNLVLWLLLFLWCLVVVGTPLAWAAICIVRWAQRRRMRRQLMLALDDFVRQAQELNRDAQMLAVQSAHHVFALHRELRRGIEARA